MRLGDKIPVPQLSAAQASRVQRQVMARVNGEPEVSGGWFGSRLRLAVAGAALAAVAVALVLDVPGAIRDRGAVAAGSGVVITELASGGDAVTAQLGDASVTLAPETRASIIRWRGGIEVALERGRVDCEVEPKPGRTPLSVGAADVEVVVVGTIFSVERDGEVRVEVERGKVEVRSPAGVVLVEAGRAWTAAGGVVSMVASADEVILDDGDGGETDGATATASSASASASGDDGGHRGGERIASATPSRRTRSPVAGPDARRADRRRDNSGKTAGRKRPPRYRAPGGNSALLEAMELESSDPRAAIRAYTAIAAESRGSTASFALYSKAYVEHFKLGARAAAVETLDLFNRRFPRAREAQSAQWLRVLGLCDLGRVGECRAAAYSYIRRFPDGMFVDAVSVVVNR